MSEDKVVEMFNEVEANLGTAKELIWQSYHKLHELDEYVGMEIKDPKKESRYLKMAIEARKKIDDALVAVEKALMKVFELERFYFEATE